MDYRLIHDRIVSRARERCLEGYCERHHVIPKCLGGTDDVDNLVKLTAREHFIIHKILCLLYPHEGGLHWAAFMMAGCSGNAKQDRGYRVGAREYARLRENLKLSDETKAKISIANKGKQSRLGAKLTEETKKKMSDARKGQVSPTKGMKHTQETRDRMSSAAQTRPNRPHTEETREKLSAAWERWRAGGNEWSLKGIPRSEDTKHKISESKKGKKRDSFSKEWLDNLSKSLQGKVIGKIWITNGVESSMIHESDGIPDGWWKGMTRKGKTK